MTLVHTGFIPLPPGQQSGFDHADVYRDTAGSVRLYAVLDTIPLPGEPDVVMYVFQPESAGASVFVEAL